MNVTWYLSDGNQSFNDKTDGVSDAVVVSSLIVALWILLANSTIAVCFIINRKIKWPTFSTQVLCLSITDIVVGLGSLPLTILPLICKTISYRYCSLIFFIFFASQCASLYQIFGICVHRCIITNKASRINEQRSDFRVPLALVLSSWTLSSVVNSLLLFLYGRTDATVMQCQFNELFTGNINQAATFLFIIYFVPYILTNVLYMFTCFRLRCIWKKIVPAPVTEMEGRSNRVPHVVSGVGIQENNIPSMSGNSVSIRAQQKVITTIGTLMLFFNICTIPLIVLFLIQNQYPVSRTVKFIVVTLFLLNSAINPFIYALRTNWLRIALKRMFRDGCRVVLCQR